MKLLKEFVAQPLQTPIREVVEESADDLVAKKERFAELFLRTPENAFAVACIIYPDDTGKALRASTEWPNDPDVQTLLQSLKDAAEEFDFHPTKEQFARKLLNTAETMLSVDPQTAHRYHESYRKMRWPDTAVSINDNRVVNNVMVVKDYGDENQWESKALANQRKLKEDSAVVSTVSKIN